MPIYNGPGGVNMAAIYHGSTPIARVYNGSTLVWDMPYAPRSQVVDTTTASVTTGTSMSIDVPDCAVGDLLFVQLVLDGVTGDNPSPTVSGLRRLYRFPNTSGATPMHLFAKEVEAGDIDASLSIGWVESGWASALAATITDCMHIDFVTTDYGSGTATPTHTAGTAAENDELLLLWLSYLNGTRVPTEPSGTVLEAALVSGSSSSDVGAALSSYRQAVAGATDAHTWTLSGSTTLSTARLMLGVANARTPATSSGIEFVGGKTFDDAGAGASTFTIHSLNGLTGGSDTRIQPGDLIVLAQDVHYNNSGSIESGLSVPGFTTAAYVVGSDTAYTHLLVQYRIADKSDGTIRLNGNQKGSGTNIAAAVMVFRGVDPDNPLDVSVTTSNGNNTGRPDPSAITPSTSGAMIVVAGAGGYATNPVLTSSDLTGFIAHTVNNTFDSNLGMGYHAWTGGTFDPAAWGGGTTSTNASWAAVTMALSPA